MEDTDMNVTDFRKYIAEFTGTLTLVLLGCGSAVAANALYTVQGLSVPLAFTTLTIAVAFGLVIVAMAYSIGNVSGCHINPAVSVAMFVARRMTLKDLIGYLAAQFAGGLAGAYVLSLIINTRASLGQNGYGAASALGLGAGAAVAVEIILTFIFVMVILCVTSKPEYSSLAGLVIGLTLTLVHIFGIPFTGTSVNPARSFGPAVLAGGDALRQLPVFIIAPLIGGVLASLFFTFVLEPGMSSEDEPEKDLPEDGKENADNEDADVSEEPEEAAPEEAADTAEETADTAPEKAAEEAPAAGYDPVEDMLIEPVPESVAEAEAGIIEEADANASIE